MKSNRQDLYRNERGAIVMILAVCSVLVVMLAIALSIDLPLAQSSKTRAQVTIDSAALHALRGGAAQYSEIVELADSAIRSTEEGLPGRFSTTLEDDTGLRFLVPRYGAGYFSQPAAPSAAQLGVFGQIFDVDVIDDFRNGLLITGSVTPDQYLSLPLLNPSGPLEVATAVQLNTVISYVLFDPSFSMEENFVSLFGPGGLSTSGQWPVLADVLAHGAVQGSWNYPSGHGLFKSNPLGRGTAPPPSGSNPNTLEEIYHFYAALCDSAPWSYYKWAAVDLVDRLSRSSAYNFTTYVGLTGFNGDFPVVPIHPVEFNNTLGVITHPYDPDDPSGSTHFPLQQSPIVSNRGLHRKKSAAFQGFFNTDDPSVRANWGADGDYDYGAGDDLGSGLNQWELCFCSGLYRAGSDYLLTPDIQGSDPNDDNELSHQSESRRRRSGSSNTHWCDDAPNFLDQQILNGVSPVVPDVIVNLQDHQSGAGGESPRNLLAGLAIRVQNPQLETVMNPPLGQWTRPAEPSDELNPDESLDTGARYLPLALAEAALMLQQAKLDYNADALFGAHRPAYSAELIALTMAPWSQSTERKFLDAGFSLDDMIIDFRDTLAFAICERKVNVTLAFLPMSEYDRNAIGSILGVLTDFEVYINSDGETQGSYIPTSTCPIGLQTGKLRFFAVDYAELEPSTDPQLQKLKAAALYRTTVPENIMKSLISVSLPL